MYIVAALYLSMIAWVAILLAHSANTLRYETFELETYAALQVLYCAFQAASYVFVVWIARMRVPVVEAEVEDK